MPTSLQRFRTYEIAEDPGGASLELWRTDREVVCLASVPADQRWVELHVLAGVDTQDPASRPVVEGFRSHIQALMRLRDRRVLEVLEAGEDEGALFYATEFIDGETLDVYLARCTPLPAWWAVELARQLTLGLLALRRTPALLASTQVFNARLTLEGEATTDALVKLADFDLGGPAAATPPDSATAEAQAVQQVGRLLCYALSGLVAEQITPRQLAALPLPPEIADLLARLLPTPGRFSPSDLPRLLAALTASAHSPSLAAAPARLPPALRPRLPLAPHFPTLTRLAAELGDRIKLERSPFDAAQPYVQRGMTGPSPVTVQLLPPSRLLAPDHLPAVRLAAERATARPTPHVLRVLELAALDDPGWFLEETTPRINLDRARRLRRSLSPGEAAFFMREFDKAVLALETRGLPPVALCPQEVYLDFMASPGGPPGDDELAAQPVNTWPEFKLKMRAHPVAIHLAQPRRFLRERLLDPCPPRASTDPPPGPPAGLGSPTAADYAALFVWLCGGLTAVPPGIAPLITSTLAGGSETTRSAVVDALAPWIPKPQKPTAPAPKTSAPPPTRKGKGAETTKSLAKGRRHKNAAAPASAAPKPATPGLAIPIDAADTAPAAAHATGGFLSPETASTWEDEGGLNPESESAGFAEVLLGASPSSALLPPAALPPLFTGEPEVERDEDLPVGALFGSWSAQDRLEAGPSFDDRRGFDFSPAGRAGQPPSLWRLVVLVVIVAMIIAALTAHFTGLAPWR